jgi:hypothetical protein
VREAGSGVTINVTHRDQQPGNPRQRADRVVQVLEHDRLVGALGLLECLVADVEAERVAGVGA